MLTEKSRILHQSTRGYSGQVHENWGNSCLVLEDVCRRVALLGAIHVNFFFFGKAFPISAPLFCLFRLGKTTGDRMERNLLWVITAAASKGKKIKCGTQAILVIMLINTWWRRRPQTMAAINSVHFWHRGSCIITGEDKCSPASPGTPCVSTRT